jgi:hypothetical protein
MSQRTNTQLPLGSSEEPREGNLLLQPSKLPPKQTGKKAVGPKIDIFPGLKTGRLTVIRSLRVKGKKNWECMCECGTEVICPEGNLRSGQRSCGCYRLQIVSTRGGASKHPLYHTWKTMRNRCHNPKDHWFRIYGARGISVCNEWKDFWKFAEDMSPRPDGHTLDRIDNSGPYSKENCRWATAKQQVLNTRLSMRFFINGEWMTADDGANALGIGSTTVRWRGAHGKMPSKRLYE